MRWWTEAVAAVADHVPVPLLVLLSVAATALIALAWYTWPRWSPARWRLPAWRWPDGRLRFRLPRIRLRWRWRWRWPWRRRRRRKAEPDVDVPDIDDVGEEVPEVPAQVLTTSADDLAAAGRYAEAVRERLRAVVRALIEADVIPHRPGWTVTELVASAGMAQPAIAADLTAATAVFSAIWYGLRLATVDDDAAMRRYAAAVTRTLAAPVSTRGGGT
jgi:uncharacterized protein DUF4129